jgi:hypothetical protein
VGGFGCTSICIFVGCGRSIDMIRFHMIDKPNPT